MSELFLKEVDSRGVCVVKLNRPEIHNAFNDELIQKLTNLFLEINNDDEIRLVVLTGEGRSFCAGADLNWMKSMVNYTEAENIEDSKELFKMFDSINVLNKPVIGKINGHALGGGVGLVSVCDYAITHEKAKFGFTEVRLGLIPAVISSFCINKIGESHARAWFMSGEMFKSDQALKMGLVHEVTSLDHFEERFEELVTSFLKAGPEAAVESKKLIKNVMSLNEEQIEDYTCKAIASRRVSPEGQEGMSALLEKRLASWVNHD
jgi:methylglutaconyl-CoA hydratase